MTQEDYFIDLILKKCVSFKHTKSLFIAYNSYNEEFIQKLLAKLDNKVKDIYLDCKDPFFEHDLLQKLSVDEIKSDPYFSDEIYDKYAKKKASFLIFMSPVPGLMNDIDDEKLMVAAKRRNETKTFFAKQEITYQIPWCILPLYNSYWEESLGINNLQEILYKVCMIDENDIVNWQKLITKNEQMIAYLNELKLDSLHITNKLGTDIVIGLPQDYLFEGINSNPVYVNLPSYEIFTSPNYKLTQGIVYNSKPLLYNGAIIDNFYLEFKDGKVVNYHAEKGQNILKSILEFDAQASFLGEVALVEVNSPINQTNLIFKSTLLDENASCHLALGKGFGNGSPAKLKKMGINDSKIHVDFMIGTDDTKVTGLRGNEEITLMENGLFVQK